MIVSRLISLKCAHKSKLVRGLWLIIIITLTCGWLRCESQRFGSASTWTEACPLMWSLPSSWWIRLPFHEPWFPWAWAFPCSSLTILMNVILLVWDSYKFEVQRVFLLNLLMCSYTIVVADDAVNRGWRAIRFSKSDVLWDTLLSSSADIADERIDAGVVGLSEIFLLLGINHTFLDTHLVELLEITLSFLGLALWVKFPWGGHNTSIFLITTVSLTKGEAFRRKIASGGLSLTHVILDQEKIFFVD